MWSSYVYLPFVSFFEKSAKEIEFALIRKKLIETQTALQATLTNVELEKSNADSALIVQNELMRQAEKDLQLFKHRLQKETELVDSKHASQLKEMNSDHLQRLDILKKEIEEKENAKLASKASLQAEWLALELERKELVADLDNIKRQRSSIANDKIKSEVEREEFLKAEHALHTMQNQVELQSQVLSEINNQIQSKRLVCH